MYHTISINLHNSPERKYLLFTLYRWKKMRLEATVMQLANWRSELKPTWAKPMLFPKPKRLCSHEAKEEVKEPPSSKAETKCSPSDGNTKDVILNRSMKELM